MSKNKWGYEWHHRKCRSNGGDSSDRNLSRIPAHWHRAWHLLFRNYEAERIAKIINATFLDPDYELVVRKREKL